jgi:predicted phosphate transport protein (TIGR00153 family)
MKFNSIVSIFTPKDRKFFPLLKDAADILDKAATLLEELFSSGTSDEERVMDLCRAIKHEETEGDKVNASIYKELNDTFLTPLDREDISALADEIDDAIDAINRAAQKVLLFSPEALPPATAQLAQIIKKGTIEVQAAAHRLDEVKKSGGQVRLHIKRIKQLEEEVDGVYEKGTSGLFKTDMKPLELIKSKEIIQELEKSANKINSVGKVLKTIIVKYA